MALLSPDAPIVQIGDFHFGRERLNIERAGKPKLLVWMMNNYWDSKFTASQPGVVSFQYMIHTLGPLSGERPCRDECPSIGVLTHPIFEDSSPRRGPLDE